MASSTPGSVSMMILRGSVTPESVRRRVSWRFPDAPLPETRNSGVSIGLAYRNDARSAVAGDLVQRDARRDARVEGLHGAGDRDAGEVRTVLAHQPRQAVALAAHDHEDRPVERELAHLDLALTGEAHDREAHVGRLRQHAVEVGRLRDRDPGRGTRGRLPRGRRHLRRPALGDDDALRAERGRRADHGAEVAGIGDLVQRDQEPDLGVQCIAQYVVRVRVLVGRQLQRHPLVHGTARQAVELVARDLEHRHRVRRRVRQDLAQTIIALGTLSNVRRTHRQPRLQRLEHRVTPDDPLRSGAGLARLGRAAGPPLALACLVGRILGPVRLVVRAVLGPRRWTLALEPATDATTRPGGTPLGARALACLAYGSLARRVSWHQLLQRGPEGVSSTEMPRLVSRSRIASDAAKSLRARAAWRCSSSSEMTPSRIGRRRASPPPAHASSSARSPNTSSMLCTETSAALTASASPAVRAWLPTRTISYTSAIAVDVPRSSLNAATKEGGNVSYSVATGPTSSIARSTKPSMRLNDAVASLSDSELYSIELR